MMMRLFWQKTWLEKRIFLEACFWLAFASIAKSVWKFDRMSFLLGEKDSETGREELPQHKIIRTVGWAVEAGGRHLPWHPVCLSRAIAAKWMLQIRGIPSTIYFGGRMKENRMWLHAWLRCGNRILTGGAERRQVEKICSYS